MFLTYTPPSSRCWCLRRCIVVSFVRSIFSFVRLFRLFRLFRIFYGFSICFCSSYAINGTTIFGTFSSTNNYS